MLFTAFKISLIFEVKSVKFRAFFFYSFLFKANFAITSGLKRDRKSSMA